MNSVVIVGANLAGGRAAEALRAEGFGGRVVLVGEEIQPPYARPQLSKRVLRGEQPPEATLLRPDPTFYGEQAIELRLGVRAVRLDPSGTVELATGETLAFDACLLCTGGTVRTLPVPGADLPHVRFLRTWEDAVRLRDLLATRPRVCVIGAGFIGLEVAASARVVGCEVEVIEIGSQPLGRALPADVASVFTAIHADHGVRLHLGEGVERIEPDAVVSTSGRRFTADVVVMGVGIAPADALARDAGIACGDGVLVDALCRTSAQKVWAAGDVACGPSGRVEHFQNAQDQGLAAARSILGRTEPSGEVAWFWSDQYDANLQMLGHPRPDDDAVTRGTLDGRTFTRLFVRDGLVVAAIALNRGPDIAAARRLIERRTAVDPSRLADQDTNLRELLRA